MSIKSFVTKYYAKYKAKEFYRMANQAVECQNIIFEDLIDFAKDTYFGKAHQFASIKTYEDFKEAVPIRTYEDGKHFFDLAVEGKSNILWPGKPLYFAKTSGTTSGSKLIPITQESIHNHITGAKMVLLCSTYHRNTSDFVNGKMIFMSGSPTLENINGVLTGRLSGIVNHHIPNYLQKNQVPSWETNCIEDWEKKVDAIVNETIGIDMTLISGIPPWVLMYFERLLEKTGKQTIKEVFPNFDIFVQGGVNYEPYRAKLDSIIGGKIAMLETYPSSEGFIAFQDTIDFEGLILNTNAGIFFEFVPANEIINKNPTRLRLQDVKVNVNYALVLTTNAGLWAYDLGDTVKFISTNPYRIIVTGRTKHFISAFGEHVIAEEVDRALIDTASKHHAEVIEFHVAPIVNHDRPHHQWMIAFDKLPNDIENFAHDLDYLLQQSNSYYKDLRVGNMLSCLQIKVMQSDAFRKYMKTKGKLGGQHKVPRLANNQDLADELLPYVIN